MSIVKVDTDGTPYWDQFTDTHLDYTANWSSFVAIVSDTVSSATWSSNPTGLTLSSATLAGNKPTIWASPSAGNANVTYTITSKIFTPLGRGNKLQFRIKVL